MKELATRNIPVDLLLSAGQLADAVRLFVEIPNLRAVVNHIGNPTLDEVNWAGWAKGIERVAGYPTAYCKLSGKC